MAEINQNPTLQKSSNRKTYAVKVDLTPMVDLAFLLITFFMFTTTLAKPNLIDIKIPSDAPIHNQTKLAADKALTILIDKNHTVFYYEGLSDDLELNHQRLKSTSFHHPSNNLSKVIKDKINRVNVEFNPK